MKTSFENPAPYRHSFLIGLGVIFIVIGSFSGCSVSYSEVLKTLKAPPVAAIHDGVYKGGYFLLPVRVEVRVIVKSGKIQSIELLKHFNGQGKPAEVLPDRILRAQSIDVDVISGATHSSVVILKAIENALNKGL